MTRRPNFVAARFYCPFVALGMNSDLKNVLPFQEAADPSPETIGSELHIVGTRDSFMDDHVFAVVVAVFVVPHHFTSHQIAFPNRLTVNSPDVRHHCRPPSSDP